MKSQFAIGDLTITNVSGGRLRIDGGNMFGVVPRVMWERESPPDEQNRIRLDTNCIIIRTKDSLGIVDTGYGGKQSPRQVQRYALEDGAPLTRNLAAAGIDPSDVTWVILTHLHFDHAGGATYHDSAGQLQPMFPRARHFVQRAEWDDAVGRVPELAGAYFSDDFAPLERAGILELVEGDAEIAPGISVQATGGHTRGHQIVRVESGGRSAVCLADICPTAAHLRTFWTMSYDQFPLSVRRIKPVVLNELIDCQRIALFSHDPDVWAATLAQDEAKERLAVPYDGP